MPMCYCSLVLHNCSATKGHARLSKGILGCPMWRTAWQVGGAQTLTWRVGQNRIYTPYMTVYSVVPLPKIPYIHRICTWFWPTLLVCAYAWAV